LNVIGDWVVRAAGDAVTVVVEAVSVDEVMVMLPGIDTPA
jgi:hypothetical protein